MLDSHTKKLKLNKDIHETLQPLEELRFASFQFNAPSIDFKEYVKMNMEEDSSFSSFCAIRLSEIAGEKCLAFFHSRRKASYFVSYMVRATRRGLMV